MQCAILAGGLATRLEPITTSLPKALVPVAGRPFADHQLTWLASQGVTDVVYCIGHLGEQIRAFASDGAHWGLRIAYVDEGPALRGTAGALRLAYDAGELEAAFIVLYADSYLAVELQDVRACFDDRRPAALMTVFQNHGRFDRSNAQLAGGWVVRYDKGVTDPAAEGMEHIDYGLSMIDRDAVVAGIPADEVVDLADVYQELAAGGRLAGYEVHERFYEVGSPSGLSELESYLSRSGSA